MENIGLCLGDPTRPDPNPNPSGFSLFLKPETRSVKPDGFGFSSVKEQIKFEKF